MLYEFTSWLTLGLWSGLFIWNVFGPWLQTCDWGFIQNRLLMKSDTKWLHLDINVKCIEKRMFIALLVPILLKPDNGHGWTNTVVSHVQILCWGSKLQHNLSENGSKEHDAKQQTHTCGFVKETIIVNSPRNTSRKNYNCSSAC